MKMKILYLLLLCVIAGIGIMIKLYVYDRQTALEGNLQIVSVPESSVFVNAEAMGRTPFNHALKP
jgi:hypothetical protein